MTKTNKTLQAFFIALLSCIAACSPSAGTGDGAASQDASQGINRDGSSSEELYEPGSIRHVNPASPTITLLVNQPQLARDLGRYGRNCPSAVAHWAGPFQNCYTFHDATNTQVVGDNVRIVLNPAQCMKQDTAGNLSSSPVSLSTFRNQGFGIRIAFDYQEGNCSTDPRVLTFDSTFWNAINAYFQVD